MSILVIGATGTVGSLVVQGLAKQGASVSALVRDLSKAKFPTGVKPVVGDLTNIGTAKIVDGAPGDRQGVGGASPPR